MCCRAVDAHLGLIQEPVWELAERVVARLPNLKAVVFETMPEYFRSEGITSNEVASEIDRLRHLCDSRDSAVPEVKEATADRLPVETAGGDTAAWEHTLGQVVAGHASGGLTAGLQDDPGTAIYRKLATSVRIGVVTDSLRLTYRLLTLEVGTEGTEQILHRHIDETPAQPVALDEARQFVEWLVVDEPEIDDITEVIAFELATIDAQLSGEAQTMVFNRDPIELLEALGAGTLPSQRTPGEYVLEVTP